MGNLGKFTREELEYRVVELERVESEREISIGVLRESEAGYRELFISNPQPMWVYDLDSLGFLAVNSAAISHYGYSEKEFLSMTIENLHPPEYMEQSLSGITHGANALYDSGACRHIRKDGSVIDVEITSHTVLFDRHRAQMVLAHDITERRRLDKEREQLQAQLIQSQKMESIGRLAGGVGHDFNNMISVILGYTEMAMEQLDSTQPMILTSLQEIRMAAEHSAKLTRQLLGFARKQIFTPRVLDLNDTVENMLNMLRRLIGEHIDLSWIPGENIWPVKVDPAQIDQILANLCVNSRDAIHRGGKVAIQTDNVFLDEAFCEGHTGFIPGKYVLMAVNDDGCGMDRDVLNKIFEPFFTTKEVGRGTGLGMATVYGIVKQNNGFIDVSSEPEKGTSVRIYLPALVGKTIPVDKKGAVAPANQGPVTILLVEDEAALLKMIRIKLQRQNYTVLSASTPAEAIRIAEAYAHDIHLILTDVVMPGMHGRDLVRRLSPLHADIKALYMSGYTAEGIARRGMLEADVNFIQKPFSMSDMIAKIHEVLGSGK